jgi:hypothetical protein
LNEADGGLAEVKSDTSSASQAAEDEMATESTATENPVESPAERGA